MILKKNNFVNYLKNNKKNTKEITIFVDKKYKSEVEVLMKNHDFKINFLNELDFICFLKNEICLSRFDIIFKINKDNEDFNIVEIIKNKNLTIEYEELRCEQRVLFKIVHNLYNNSEKASDMESELKNIQENFKEFKAINHHYISQNFQKKVVFEL
jgi:hypothetical protein